MNKDTALQRKQTLERVKRYRERSVTNNASVSKSVTKTTSPTVESVTYDYDLDLAEIVMLHVERTQDQVDRFPMIPLPFGRAYYEALEEQKRT